MLSNTLTLIGSLLGRNIVGVGIDSCDDIMNGKHSVLVVVEADPSSDKTVDDLSGKYYTDPTMPVNVRIQTIILNEATLKGLKKILIGKKAAIEFKTIRFTHKNTEVAIQSASSNELLEALNLIRDLILKNS